MATANGVARKRESRPALTERLPMICLLGGDDQKDTTELLRRQRLLPFGLTETRANLIAELAWGALV